MHAGWRIHAFDAVASTNDEARRLAEAGEPGPAAVVARAQTAGRGRLGRAWRSGPGGLYVSAILRPELPASRAGLVPLAAGVAAAEVVEGLGLEPELRWPNDVLVRGRKVAGVLCESRLRPAGDRLAWVVVGLGLNVAQPDSELAPVGGASLAGLAGKALEPDALLHPLLGALGKTVALAEARPEALLEAWRRRAPMLGKLVEVATPGGPVGGQAEGVAPTGALIVRTPEGRRELTDADVVRVR